MLPDFDDALIQATPGTMRLMPIRQVRLPVNEGQAVIARGVLDTHGNIIG